MKKEHAILTVHGKDRPGIVADVTGCLYKAGCNLEDITMTILEGQFVMILILSCSSKTLRKLKLHLNAAASGQFFYHLDSLMGIAISGRQKLLRDMKKFLITAIGKDRTGIVYAISRYLAAQHFNITDLNSRLLNKGPRLLYALALEIDVPRNTRLQDLSKKLKKIGKNLQVDIILKDLEPLEF